MQQEGWTVVMYDPDRPWDDATQEIKQTIETASAVGYLEGASSNWIRAEIELSENGRVPLFRFQDLTQLEALLPAIREASQRINLVERLLSCHPHDREMIAVQLFARHVDGLDRGGRDAPFIKAMLPVMELVHDPRYYGQRILLVLFTVVFWLCLAIGVVLLIVYAAGLFLAKIF